MFLLGFLTAMAVVILWSRVDTRPSAAAPPPARIPDALQPELALERAEVRRTTTPTSASATPGTPTTNPVDPPPGIAELTSAVDVEQWLETQAARLASQKNWSRRDPLIDGFARVPSAYWEVMLEKSGQFAGAARGMMEEALIRSSGTQHRELVLRAFPERHFLIAVIVRHGWVADCAEVIRDKLADPTFSSRRLGDTHAFIAALATLQDERDFHRFLVIMRDHHYGYWQARIARTLATIPAFDHDTAVQSSWRRYDVAAYLDRQDGFAVAAARVGLPDALAITVLHAAGGNGTRWSSGELQDEARALLRDHLGLHVDPDDPAPALRWWESAKDQVRWEAQARRWAGPPPPPAPAPVVAPTITEDANDF